MNLPLASVVSFALLACCSTKHPEKQASSTAAVEQSAALPDNKKQSFFDGMQTLCESYQRAPKSDSAAEAQKHLHRWIETNVTNIEVREVFTLIGTMPPGQRSPMMRAAAAKVGLTRCSLAGD